MSPRIEAVRATAADLPAVANLFQLYIHDFAEFWFDQPRGELGANGLYEAPDNLGAYWEEADRVALLLRADGNLVGFALLNRHAYSGKPVDWNMGEFFIVRKHRRAGVGTAAAEAVFAMFPGQWEAAVARRNVGALAFWERLAKAHHDNETLDLQTPDWNGPVLRFTVRSTAVPST